MKQFSTFIVVLGIIIVSLCLTGLVFSTTLMKPSSAKAKMDRCDSLISSLRDADTVGIAVTVPRYHNTKLIIRLFRGEAKFLRKGDTISLFKPEDSDWEFDNGIPMDFKPAVLSSAEFAKGVVWANCDEEPKP